ncbi:MAG: Rieske 2Fe-2S domain-containing protein [Pseudonocardiaceae bacterium]|nr:Rieske 2Fe-2S domain-containing protein [Pseudonocardiaceae bacterium]
MRHGIPARLRRSVPWTEVAPTWRDAKPGLIDTALERAQARPSGNWYVLAASSEIRGDRPFGRTVAGVEIVAWRTADGRLHAGPGECPHLGAPLCRAAVRGGALVCRWHGLALGAHGTAGWEPFAAHDDGVLAWVRLDAVGGETPLPAPVLAARPAASSSLDAVMTLTGRCEPEDVVANRLDPWHGAWFHPYSFVDLRVIEAPSEGTEDPALDRFLVQVSFRISRRVVVPVTSPHRVQ